MSDCKNSHKWYKNKIQKEKETEPIKITIGITNKIWLIQRAKRYHWELTIIIYQRSIIIFYIIIKYLNQFSVHQ